MPYKPTGRPPGRPKTKEYETLTARIPQDIADQAREYAAQHRQTLSNVLRDGLYLLLEENRYRPFMSDTNSAPEIVSDIIAPEHTPVNMSDMNGAPASVPDVLHRQRLREIVSDTIQPEEEPGIVSDTNGTHPVPLDFDTSKYVLGKLCPRAHDYHATGQSLLRLSNRHCLACDREKFHERKQAKHQAKRQAQPA